MSQNAEKVVVLPWDLTPEEEARLHETDATSEWLRRLPAELLQQYAGKWVAARDRRIAAAGDTYGDLLAALHGIDLQTVVIRHIERPGWIIYR
jgi:hypothetical protein